MLYGQELILQLILEHELADPDAPEFEDPRFHATLAELQILQDVVFKKADDNIGQIEAKQQADFAKRRHKQKNVKVDDKLARCNLRRADRQVGKQTDSREGPYEVALVREKEI